MGKDDDGMPRADRIKKFVTKKGPNPAYLATYIQATLAMSSLLGLNEDRLQQTSRDSSRAEEITEDYSSISTEELLSRNRQAMGQS